MLKGLNHLTLSVSCLETSFKFYAQILGCKPLARWKRSAYLLAGDSWLCLSVSPNLDRSISSDYTHVAFSVSPESLQEYRQHLDELNLKLWQENTSEGDSLYILDPDRHKLELHVGNWRASPFSDSTKSLRRHDLLRCLKNNEIN